LLCCPPLLNLPGLPPQVFVIPSHYSSRPTRNAFPQPLFGFLPPLRSVFCFPAFYVAAPMVPLSCFSLPFTLVYSFFFSSFVLAWQYFFFFRYVFLWFSSFLLLPDCYSFFFFFFFLQNTAGYEPFFFLVFSPFPPEFIWLTTMAHFFPLAQFPACYLPLGLLVRVKAFVFTV